MPYKLPVSICRELHILSHIVSRWVVRACGGLIFFTAVTIARAKRSITKLYPSPYIIMHFAWINCFCVMHHIDTSYMLIHNTIMQCKTDIRLMIIVSFIYEHKLMTTVCVTSDFYLYYINYTSARTTLT